MFTKHGSTSLHNKSPRHPSYWQIGNTGSGYLQHHARDLPRQPTFTLPPGSMTSKGPSLSEHTSELRQLKIIIKCKSSTCDMFETKWLHNYKQYSGTTFNHRLFISYPKALCHYFLWDLALPSTTPLRNRSFLLDIFPPSLLLSLTAALHFARHC